MFGQTLANGYRAHDPVSRPQDTARTGNGSAILNEQRSRSCRTQSGHDDSKQSRYRIAAIQPAAKNLVDLHFDVVHRSTECKKSHSISRMTYFGVQILARHAQCLVSWKFKTSIVRREDWDQ